MERPVAAMRGLGPASSAWLHEVGIDSEAQLRDLGAPAAYRLLKTWNPRRVSLNMLWALHGALHDLPLTAIDDATKARLRAEAEAPPSSSST